MDHLSEPEDETLLPRAGRETLAIPQSVRAAVDERDGGICRVCGEFLGVERRAQHHIEFGAGVGLRRTHDIGNLITIGWLPGNRDCHSIVHGHKERYRGLLLELAAGKHAGATALQLLRWRGVVPPAGSRPRTLEEVRAAFEAQTESRGECVIWTGGANKGGYGTLTSAEMSRSRHRPPNFPILATHAAWFFHYGRWPRLALLHSCDTPPCVAVQHLREGTQAENMEDRRLRKPRFGSQNPAARHADKVDEIRRRAATGESQAAIGRALGVSQSVVSRISRGVNYPS